jgi:RNA polymerase sigma-70 factor (family 1)
VKLKDSALLMINADRLATNNKHTRHELRIVFSGNQEKAFQHFFKMYYKAIHFFACKFVNDSAVAEDIIENAFIKLWERCEQMESEAGLKSYLYKTVYHDCLRFIENAKRKRKIEGEVKIENENGHIENMIRAETLRLVYEAMEQLPPECKKVFVKLFVEGKSVADAAAELKVKISTVRNQKARGIKLLRMRLTPILVLGLMFPGLGISLIPPSIAFNNWRVLLPLCKGEVVGALPAQILVTNFFPYCLDVLDNWCIYIAT